MKYTARGIQISLITHGIFFALLFFLGSFIVSGKKPVLIDMTLSKPMVSGAGGLPAKKAGQQKLETRKEIKAHHVLEKSIMAEQSPVFPPSVSKHIPQVSSTTSGTVGKELFAGSGNDFLYGAETGALTSGKGIGGTASKTFSGEIDGPETAKKQYRREHYTYIWDLIKKNLYYPVMACKMGWEGKVVVSFVVSENGGMEDIKVIKTSGYSLLDKSAVETVRKSAPFPKPPVRAELIIPLVYKLQKEGIN